MIVVGISDYKTARRPDRLITYALGSCVGTCLFDERSGAAGLSHILLPDSTINRTDTNIMKYADTAIEALVREMERQGIRRTQLKAKIAGGANMFAAQSKSMNIGERNVAAVKEHLRRLGIRLLAEDTGKNYGRTVEFDPESGAMSVKSVLHGVHVF
ncbi:CheD [Ethanoligenens harbinense YUAN-3]|uniref:Probable chemoreceptor glutamine deamidase CheD n=1 Tax=Ethanoligenens harbinense (strain DSM 18485 / JCM 12961 / CGMCC 1.5033 / YUAN-3) TaxID=663278 RepID=E6U3K2_ETHHY|nr:CheD [Ethanoligenens harbinense YUAN-3]